MADPMTIGAAIAALWLFARKKTDETAAGDTVSPDAPSGSFGDYEARAGVAARKVTKSEFEIWLANSAQQPFGVDYENRRIVVTIKRSVLQASPGMWYILRNNPSYVINMIIDNPTKEEQAATDAARRQEEEYVWRKRNEGPAAGSIAHRNKVKRHRTRRVVEGQSGIQMPVDTLDAVTSLSAAQKAADAARAKYSKPKYATDPGMVALDRAVLVSQARSIQRIDDPATAVAAYVQTDQIRGRYTKSERVAFVNEANRLILQNASLSSLDVINLAGRYVQSRRR